MPKARDREAVAGLRILVVEDAALVALDLADQLTNCGCEVVGPVSNVAGALARLNDGPVDGAVLDINLVGETSAPIAAWLSSHDVPFIFITGYENMSMLPEEFHDRPRLDKPVDATLLMDTIASNF